MRSGVLIAWALVVFFICGLSTPATATTFHYGTFAGNTVVFQNVTESSITDASALFGGPMVTGNSLSFSPTAFGAYAVNGASDTTNGTLSMLITGIGNNSISQVVFTQHGDYSLIGPKNKDQTYVSIWASLAINIYEVNGQAIAPIVFTTDMEFTPSGGVFMLPGAKGNCVSWDGEVTLDITEILRAQGYQGFATELSLTWENDLTANSQAGTIAYIKSKEAGGTGITIVSGVVPEPITLIGVLIGLTGLATYIRKRTFVR